MQEVPGGESEPTSPSPEPSGEKQEEPASSSGAEGEIDWDVLRVAAAAAEAAEEEGSLGNLRAETSDSEAREVVIKRREREISEGIKGIINPKEPELSFISYDRGPAPNHPMAATRELLKANRRSLARICPESSKRVEYREGGSSNWWGSEGRVVFAETNLPGIYVQTFLNDQNEPARIVYLSNPKFRAATGENHPEIKRLKK